MLILTVGFFLRFFIERTLDIKVFIDYLSVGSIFYYLFMGYITLKLKNKLTLGNYITLIVFCNSFQLTVLWKYNMTIRMTGLKFSLFVGALFGGVG